MVIEEYSPLTLQEEAELSRKIHKGDRNALDELVTRNIRLVLKIASNYRRDGVDLDDLVSVGRIALIRAARKYVSSRGAKFSTYAAIWIKSEIAKYITKYRNPVTIPPVVPFLQSKVKSYIEKKNLADEEVDDVTMAHDLKHDLQLVRWLKNTYEFVPLDELSEHGFELRDDRYSDIDLEDGRLTDHVMKSRYLTEFEKLVIVYHYGLNGNSPMTYADIARIVGRSKERVRQVEQLALGKLRQNLEQHE